MRRGLLGRAWQALQSEVSSAAPMPEPMGEERVRIGRELHPLPPDISLPTVPSVHGPAPKISGAGLARELKGMKDVAAGPSGLGKKHLLFLCEKARAADIFADARPLCEFRLRLIPKPNGKWRPIAVQETLLVAFHRLLLRQTPSLRRLPAWQLAFAQMAQVKAICRAEELKRDHHLHTVDIRNAFNTIPHPAILFALHRAGTPRLTVDYIASFLQARQACPRAIPSRWPSSARPSSTPCSDTGSWRTRTI